MNLIFQAFIFTISPAFTAFEESAKTVSVAIKAKAFVQAPIKNMLGINDNPAILEYVNQINIIREKIRSFDSQMSKQKNK